MMNNSLLKKCPFFLYQVSISFSYTASGVRSKKRNDQQSAAYRSDHYNMITQINTGSKVTYFDYDADGRRVKKRSGNSETLYFDQDFEIIDGNPVLYAFAGSLRVAGLTDKSTAYYHKDHLGSTIAVSDTNGTVTESGEYLPYGMDRDAVTLTGPYRFTDQEKDYGTGLYNYDARLYDPAIGQFIIPDTVIPDTYDPQGSVATTS